MREQDVLHENGPAFVVRTANSYDVLVNKITHSELDSAYHKTGDGLSIAKARADYLAKRRAARGH